MTAFQITLTLQELDLLTALAADQLFRREFIDPKMPGFRCNTEEIGQAKALLARLHALKLPPSLKRPALKSKGGSSAV